MGLGSKMGAENPERPASGDTRDWRRPSHWIRPTDHVLTVRFLVIEGVDLLQMKTKQKAMVSGHAAA